MYPEELDEFIGIMVETDHDYQNAKLIHGDYSEFELEPEQPTKSYMEFPVN